MTPFESGLRAALARYSVRKHYVASRNGPGTRCAVFAGGVQYGEPTSHSEAQARLADLIVRDIMLIAQPRVTPAQPDYARLGFGSADEAEGRN